MPTKRQFAVVCKRTGEWLDYGTFKDEEEAYEWFGDFYGFGLGSFELEEVFLGE